MSNGQLQKKFLFTGTITAKSGLHIGGNSVGMSIGGADAIVIRNPITNEPYIPGSSLKGKMRSLIEKLEGMFGEKMTDQIEKAPYVDDPAHFICQIFGTMPEKMKDTKVPTSRLIVRDCMLTRESCAILEKSKNTDMPFTEVKTEVMIDRITSAAMPRQLERVPAGAVFEMNLILNIYDGDKEEDLVKKVFESLCLVQNDYIGGKGTRGSGEVKITVLKISYKDKVAYEALENWKKYEKESIPEELK